tara:strand:+ start:6228 stop:6977 length:750 start_codon:yes stop_codon:yes gene_type:complete
MKVLLSCDENPYYYDFWPYAKKVWEERIGISPRLILVNKKKETTEFDDDGVLHVRELDGYPVHLQAQLARIYHTKLFPDEICLVSDIDMFPASPTFFNPTKIEANCDKDSFFHLNPERREFGQFPLCYYCGYGSLYEQLFEGLSWERFVGNIIDMNFNTDKFRFSLPAHLQGKKLWFSDEIFMFSQIQKKEININLNNEMIGPRRLDREGIMTCNFLTLLDEKVVDIHLPRPLADYQDAIEKIYYTLTL